MWAALYNGFPLTYPDTSTYLASGFELETPMDRPITYGFFLMVTSLHGYSLWLSSFLQTLILVYIIFLGSRVFTGKSIHPLKITILITLLSFISSLPWINGMLLADVFTPVSILSALILVFEKDLSKREKILVYFLFILSNAMHISHIMINVMLFTSIYLMSKIGPLKSYFSSIRPKQVLILTLISLSGIIIMSSAMSKSKHIFYMGHMVENGILKKYLDENCGTHTYKLCAYKDSLPPNADRFLWDFKNSPVYKLGGWKETKDEFNQIISETFSSPEYIKLHAMASIKGTCQQLTTFSIGEGNIPFGKETQLYERVAKYTNNIDAFAGSRQSNAQLDSMWATLNWPHHITVSISLLCLIAFIFLKKLRELLPKNLIALMIFVLLGIFYNDLVCATLSTVANRFACRVIWMIPLVFLFAVLYLLDQKKNKHL